MQRTNFCFGAIVHDDASTDSTTDIIREYAKNIPTLSNPSMNRKTILKTQWTRISMAANE